MNTSTSGINTNFIILCLAVQKKPRDIYQQISVSIHISYTLLPPEIGIHYITTAH